MAVCMHDALKDLAPARQQPHALLSQLNHFSTDEMSLELDLFSRTHKPTLLLVFHAAVYVDTCFELGGSLKLGLQELRVRSFGMLDSLKARKRLESETKPANWTLEDEKLIGQFEEDAMTWLQPNDPLTLVRKTCLAKRPDMATKVLLMERHPMLCGLILLKLQLQHRQLGLRLANAWESVMHCSHLVVACRHSAAPDASGPQWPDLDKLLEMHEPSIFNGKVPSTLEESQSSYLRLQHVPVQVLQAMRFKGAEAVISTPDRPGTERNHKLLQDHTLLLPVLLKHFLGDENGERISINAIEVLLQDLRMCDEREGAKKQRKEVTGTGRSRRKRRSKASTRFTIPQLLSVLETSLRRESEALRFDYVSMHIRCLQVLGIIVQSAHAYLASLLQDKYFVSPQNQLARFAGYLLYGAAAAKREEEEISGKGGKARDSSCSLESQQPSTHSLRAIPPRRMLSCASCAMRGKGSGMRCYARFLSGALDEIDVEASLFPIHPCQGCLLSLPRSHRATNPILHRSLSHTYHHRSRFKTMITRHVNARFESEQCYCEQDCKHDDHQGISATILSQSLPLFSRICLNTTLSSPSLVLKKLLKASVAAHRSVPCAACASLLPRFSRSAACCVVAAMCST